MLKKLKYYEHQRQKPFENSQHSNERIIFNIPKNSKILEMKYLNGHRIRILVLENESESEKETRSFKFIQYNEAHLIDDENLFVLGYNTFLLEII